MKSRTIKRGEVLYMFMDHVLLLPYLSCHKKPPQKKNSHCILCRPHLIGRLWGLEPRISMAPVVSSYGTMELRDP